MTIWAKAVLSILAPVTLGACGLSQSYREAQLEHASAYDVCYAATNPRQHSIGMGARVRADAARAVAQRRGIECDYEKFARIHALEAPSRQADMQRSLMMMQMGVQMMNQGGTGTHTMPVEPTGGGAAMGTAFFKSEYTHGMNKVCLYDRMGSSVAITVGAVELCPLTLP